MFQMSRIASCVATLALLLLFVVPDASGQSLLDQSREALETEKYDRAVTLTDSLIRQDTLDLDDRVPTAYLVQGKAFDAQGEWKEAVDAFDDALARDPYFTEAYVEKARILVERGDLTQALAATDEAVRLSPTSQQVLLQHAGVHYKLESYDAAIDAYTRVLSLNPQSVEALLFRGRSRLALGRQEKAYQDAQRAIQLDPGRPAPYRIKADAFFGTRQYSAAAEAYGQLIERLDPSTAGGEAVAAAYNNRGNARLAAGNAEGALPDLNRALEIDPDFAYAYRNRGMAYGELNQRDAACTDLRRALDLGYTEKHGSDVQEVVDSYCPQS